MKFWANMLFYQATWLIAISGAAHGLWWAGPIAVAVFAAWQLPLSDRPRADLLLLLVSAAAGFAIDSAFVRGELLSYAAPVPWPDFAPVWIVALWMSFSLTLNHSLAYLKSHLGIAALLGAIGAPLAYWAAARTWGALSFVAPERTALAWLALIWALLTPALCAFARWRWRQPAAPSLALPGTPS